LKGNFQEQIFANKYFSLPIEFTTLVARPLTLERKSFPREFKSEKLMEFKISPNYQIRKIRRVAP
jgi:hypothetical protein